MDKKNYVLKKIGRTKPIFLWEKQGETWVYLDVAHGTRLKLQYTFDDQDFIQKRRQDVEWHDLEVGFIEGDFAFEVASGVRALRLKVYALNYPINLTLQHHPHK